MVPAGKEKVFHKPFSGQKVPSVSRVPCAQALSPQSLCFRGHDPCNRARTGHSLCPSNQRRESGGWLRQSARPRQTETVDLLIVENGARSCHGELRNELWNDQTQGLHDSRNSIWPRWFQTESGCQLSNDSN